MHHPLGVSRLDDVHTLGRKSNALPCNTQVTKIRAVSRVSVQTAHCHFHCSSLTSVLIPHFARVAYACPFVSTGGGNVLNVQRTVKQLINVGAKGCFLEDQRWPKRVGHMKNKEVVSMEEFAGKVRHPITTMNSSAVCQYHDGGPYMYMNSVVADAAGDLDVVV